MLEEVRVCSGGGIERGRRRDMAGWAGWGCIRERDVRGSEGIQGWGIVEGRMEREGWRGKECTT